MNKMSKVLLTLLAGVALATAAPSTTEEARQIVNEAQRRSAVASVIYEGVLRVTNTQGKTTEKGWQVLRIGSHGASKTVIRFTNPPEVKGVALLIINHPERTSDQWMWIPAVGRERKIAVQNRSSRFFDTDFSFEDLEERDVDQYDFTRAEDTSVDGVSCWVIEAIPRRSKSSQYTSSKLYIRQQDYALAQIDNYVADKLVRTFKYQDIRNYGGILTPLVTEIYDVPHHRRTVFLLATIRYNSGLKEEDFTIEAIRGNSAKATSSNETKP